MKRLNFYILVFLSFFFITCQKSNDNIKLKSNEKQEDSSGFSNQLSDHENKLKQEIKGKVSQAYSSNSTNVSKNLTNPSNPNNPYDSYGKACADALTYANSNQKDINIDNNAALDKYSSDARNFIIENSDVPKPSTYDDENYFELWVINFNVQLFSVQDNNVDSYIAITTITENIISSSFFLGNNTKLRLLSSLSALKHIAFSIHKNSITFNGNKDAIELRASGGPGFDNWMRSTLEETFNSWFGWAGFISDFGGGPGASTLLIAAECAIRG